LFPHMANLGIHYRTIGFDIRDQSNVRMTVFVAVVGTGGTISDVARYLKEQNPDVKIVGAVPEGSVLSGDKPRPWKVEGIGEDFVPRLSTVSWWTSGSASATPRRSTRRGRWPAAKASWPAVPAAPASPRHCATRAA